MLARKSLWHVKQSCCSGAFALGEIVMSPWHPMHFPSRTGRCTNFSGAFGLLGAAGFGAAAARFLLVETCAAALFVADVSDGTPSKNKVSHCRLAIELQPVVSTIPPTISAEPTTSSRLKLMPFSKPFTFSPRSHKCSPCAGQAG